MYRGLEEEEDGEDNKARESSSSEPLSALLEQLERRLRGRASNRRRLFDSDLPLIRAQVLIFFRSLFRTFFVTT